MATPIITDNGRADLNSPRPGPWGYLSQSPFVQYNPASPDQVRQAYQEQQELFSTFCSQKEDTTKW
jgi:hypothetical protein